MYSFAHIGTGQLARLVRLAVDVDNVVGDLKRGAHHAAEAAQPFDLFVGGTGEHPTQPAGRPD
ncbi:Uncharacterised protein [Mycobacterium tuberculosis]|uniref:Uncharacterized protein n=1 Tax=Mycobacterium tuberculosis TaxID=1773 RepID=A0A916LH33_MYCTX|nr:Uncharacterised protein [Mycobacterium tuberculosis]CPB08235.1 Uncharacterised protein [Mycobacterium tuberculosis]